MKHVIIVFVVVFMCGVQLFAQEKSQISVKGHEVVTGVVIITAQRGKNTIELQCNQGSPGCARLKTGDYVMVQLPKNRGLYDCRNVEIYPSAADSEASESIGQYCLTKE